MYGSPKDLDISPLSGFMDLWRWPMYLRAPIINLAKLPPWVITNTSDLRQTRKSRAAKLVTCFLNPSNSSLVASSSFVTCQKTLESYMRLKHQTFYKKIHFERVLSQARHLQKTQLQKLSQRSQLLVLCFLNILNIEHAKPFSFPSQWKMKFSSPMITHIEIHS